MEDEIILADKSYRKKILFYLIILVIVCSIILLVGSPIIERTLYGQNPEKGMKITAILMFVFCLLPIPIGFYLLSIANRILREDRYPPTGLKMVKDTVVIHGEKAKLRAYLLLLFAFLIFFICIFCAISVHIFLKILITTGSLA